MTATMNKPKSRRARGSGSIFYNAAKQRWIGRKVVGHSATGKPMMKEVWAATQREVVRKLEGAGPPSDSTTFASWAARWLTTLTTRPATRANHAEALDLHLLPALGHLRIVDLRASRFEALAAELKAKGLHVNTVLRILDTARTVIAAAVRDDLLDKNPVAIARRPKPVKKAIHPFTPAELRSIITEAERLSSGPLIALLAATGCRLGEASALDVQDWIESKGTIAITKTYSKRFGLGPPKSKYSKRTITVPAVARRLITAAAGTRINAPLFITEKGNYVIKSLVYRAFKRILTRLGLEQRNVHQLRHSVATALISAGVPLGDVAKYLGDSPATVVRTYLHAAGTNPGAAMDDILDAPAPTAIEAKRA